MKAIIFNGALERRPHSTSGLLSATATYKDSGESLVCEMLTLELLTRIMSNIAYFGIIQKTKTM